MNQLPKSFNLLATTIDSDYTLVGDKYNVVYSQPTTDITLVLPELIDVIDGFLLVLRNFGPANMDIIDTDSSPVGTLFAGGSLFLVADKQILVPTWKSVLGPIGGGSGVPVSGPGLTTNRAIALWNGTTGEFLQNSSVLVDAGAISGVTTLTTTGSVQIGGNISTLGNLIYGSGPNTTTFSNTPSGNNTWTFRNVSDSVVGLSTADNLSNKNMLSTTNTIAASYLNSATTQVRINNATAPSTGQALIATSSTAATWQTLPTSLSGPGSSTANAIALWTNTSGNAIKNSVVLVDNLGNFTGVNNVTSGGNIASNNLSLNGGSISYINGSNSLSLISTPSGIRSLTLPDTSDTLVARSTTDTLLNKTLTSNTNNINANGLNTSGSPVLISSASPPAAGQGLIASNSTTASWQSVTSVSYTPATSGDWLTIPTTIGEGLDYLAQSSGTFSTNGVDNAVTATGNSQGTAYAIVKYLTNVTTAAASSGLVLPAAVIGRKFVIKNNGANALSIYPPVSGTIDSLGTNNPYSLGVGNNITIVAVSSTLWISLS